MTAKPASVSNTPWIAPSILSADFARLGAEVEAVLDAYVAHRASGETFQQTLHRVGFETFKVAANSARQPAKEFA